MKKTPKKGPFFQNFRKNRSHILMGFFTFPGGPPGKCEKMTKILKIDKKMVNFSIKISKIMRFS